MSAMQRFNAREWDAYLHAVGDPRLKKTAQERDEYVLSMYARRSRGDSAAAEWIRYYEYYSSVDVLRAYARKLFERARRGDDISRELAELRHEAIGRRGEGGIKLTADRANEILIEYERLASLGGMQQIPKPPPTAPKPNSQPALPSLSTRPPNQPTQKQLTTPKQPQTASQPEIEVPDWAKVEAETYRAVVRYLARYYHIETERARRILGNVVSHISEKWGVPRLRMLKILDAIHMFNDLGFDPFLVLGVFAQESGFNPNCITRNDAGPGRDSIGLGQLTPDEILRARREWRKTKWYNGSNEWQWNDIHHAVWGWFLVAKTKKAALERMGYHPTHLQIVSANNAGEGGVSRAIRKGGINWINNLPGIKRNHILKVIGYHREFCEAAGIKPRY
ncbi:MAG: hypothetical protein QXP42_05505 [Candidatus Micrarchaeia archaeon]